MPESVSNQINSSYQPHGASFRDPAGFIYRKDGALFRQINQEGSQDYDLLISSGLYDSLRAKDLIIPHEENSSESRANNAAYKIIKPFELDFISYPYEWCFGQIKDAALTTLKVEKLALQHGMSLKDASLYNIQFFKNKAVFIDTLSFQKLDLTKPWVAYRQFCEHFLTTLSLMSYRDLLLNKLLCSYVDGIPLEIAASLLPFRARLVPGLLTHIFLHSRSKLGSVGKEGTMHPLKTTLEKRMWLIENLERTIQKLSFKRFDTQWGEYYDFHNYEDAAFVEKKKLVEKFAGIVNPKKTLDIGANRGVFSRVLGKSAQSVISADVDPVAVQKNYEAIKEEKNNVVFPLLLDICNPAPAIGWHNNERDSFLSRTSVDMTLALALIHHLVISNNLSFLQVAQLFSELAPYLIIEYVGKTDSQVERMLSYREDKFPHYTQDNFEQAFKELFSIEEVQKNIRNKTNALFNESKKMKRITSNFSLLVSLLLLFIIGPLLQNNSIGSYVLAAIFVLVLASSTYAVSSKKSYLIFTLVLGFFVVFSDAALVFSPTKELFLFITASRIIFFLFIAWVMFKRLISTNEVSSDTIFGSICVYFLVGVAWAYIYVLIVMLNHDAFSFATPLVVSDLDGPIHHELFGRLMYFSFITLTTLGYGDITPVGEYARIFASIQAIFGQMYLAIVIARFVGLHLGRGRTSSPS